VCLASADRQQRRAQTFAITDLMSLQGRLDLLLGQQFREAQVLIFRRLPPTPADLAAQPSLGIFVHDRPPCSQIAITTISSAWRPVFPYSYRSLTRGLWKCLPASPRIRRSTPRVRDANQMLTCCKRHGLSSVASTTTFEGKVAGDTIKGESRWEYEGMTGSFDFTEKL
jgi:hypothetical protein